MRGAKTGRALVGLVVLLLAASRSAGVEVGGRLPEFSVRTFDGRELSRAQFEGKPLLLVFWNTWCSVCAEELPKVSRLARELGPRGPGIVAINTAINDSERKARAYWTEHGYTFPAAFDHRFEVGTALGVRAVPTVFLVDSKGVVRYKQSLLPSDVEDRFRQLSSGRKP